MADLFETYSMYTSGITASLGDGDSLFVAKNVSVVSQSIAVYSPGSALIFNEGSIYAPADAVQFGRLDALSTLTNTKILNGFASSIVA